MARGWKCPRCSTQNGEGIMNCGKCGLIQGAVFVPSAYLPPDAIPVSPPVREAMPEPTAQPTGEPPTLPAAAQGVGAPLHLGSPDGQPGVGWVPPYPVAPPRSRPLWRRVPIGLLIFGVIVIGGAVAGFVTDASRSSTGDITKSGDISSSDLRVGDCWDMKDPTADSIGDVTARPCTEAHEYEVFSIASMAEDAYPTEDAFTAYADDSCTPAFETYVGRAYEDSVLDFAWLYPGNEAWASGDRVIECSVYDPNNNQLTASMKGSGR